MENDLRVLYEEKDLFLVEKPAGMLVAPDPSGEVSLAALLAERYGGSPVPVTRLDRGVGGVAVFAGASMAAALSQAVGDHARFRKEYFAILPASPPEEEGGLTDLLYHDPRRNKTYPVDRVRKGVKEASLSYRVVAKCEGAVLVRILLHTGRTHQIRVQFASRRLPLLGDGKYGSRSGKGGIALYATRVAFPHPKTGRLVEAVSLPPETAPFTLFPREVYEQDLPMKKATR